MSGLIQGNPGSFEGTNKKEVQDVDIRLYDLKLSVSSKCEEMKLIKVVEIDKELEFGGFIIVDGENYRHCMYNREKGILAVEPVILNEQGKEIEYSDDFVCPYCGSVDNGAFELIDDGETECSSCGSELEYERIVTVGYSIIPKKCAPITRV